MPGANVPLGALEALDANIACALSADGRRLLAAKPNVVAIGATRGAARSRAADGLTKKHCDNKSAGGRLGVKGHVVSSSGQIWDRGMRSCVIQYLR